MRVHPLICLMVCGGVAAILSAAVWPATASAEAVVSTRPARPESFTISESAGPRPKGAPGVFMYTPRAAPSAYPPAPHASQGGRFAAAPTAPAAAVGTAYAPLREEPDAFWGWARPADWAAQGGAAALLYGLSPQEGGGGGAGRGSGAPAGEGRKRAWPCRKPKHLTSADANHRNEPRPAEVQKAPALPSPAAGRGGGGGGGRGLHVLSECRR